MTPKQYWTMCRVHDWFHSYSDDPEVYREGRDSEKELDRLTYGRPDLAEIYNAWFDHAFACGPRPDEPKVED